MSDPNGMGDVSDVRELLARAVGDVGRLTVSSEEVYAKAAKARWRRRAAVSGVALAFVAAGVVAVPGMASQGSGTSSVAAAPAHVQGKNPAEKLAALLPAGVGSIEQVDWAVLLKMADPKQSAEKHLGPLDGQYAVRRDGGVGYLSLDVKDRKYIAAKTGGKGMADDLCAPDHQTGPRLDCVREELPDGRVLTIWRASFVDTTGEPRWGAEFTASLTLKGGQVLLARDTTGFQGKGRLGPVLTTEPLTRAQFRELLLRPELLPGK